MTQEFIKTYCIKCKYCIYTQGIAWGCGEIDQYGCCSTGFTELKTCRLGYKPIAHEPRFKAGDRLEASPNPIRILDVVQGINGYYLTQMEGSFGRFNEIHYPIQRIDLEKIDYNFELLVEDVDDYNIELLVDDTDEPW